MSTTRGKVEDLFTAIQSLFQHMSETIDDKCIETDIIDDIITTVEGEGSWAWLRTENADIDTAVQRITQKINFASVNDSDQMLNG